MSSDTERAIDERESRAVEEQIGLVQDPALNAYVDAVGQKLASHSPRQDVRYHFHVVEMDEPNAFALPGGHIYVSRGLLSLSNSEAELANVLGHEIGHVAARHAAQRDTLAKAVTLMNVLGTIGVAVGGATSTGIPGPVGNPGLQAYSRKQESEADEIGQDLAVMAGIDPAGMASFLRRLEAHSRLKQGFSRETSYFDTHPATRERAAEAATSAEVRSWTPKFAIARTQREYLDKIAGISIGQSAGEGVVKEGRLLHPELGFVLRFPAGWEILNQRTAVIGLAPQYEAVLMLELEAPGDDPQAAALRFAEQQDVTLHEGQSLTVNELPAYRAHAVAPTPAGRREAEIAWIALDGNIYRLSAFLNGGSARRYEGVFRSFPRGFRRIEASELEQIEEQRLRIVEALGGETLAELSARTGNAWNVNETSVHNQILPGERLREGQLVKIAARERWQGRRQLKSPPSLESGSSDPSRSEDAAAQPLP